MFPNNVEIDIDSLLNSRHKICALICCVLEAVVGDYVNITVGYVFVHYTSIYNQVVLTYLQCVHF